MWMNRLGDENNNKPEKMKKYQDPYGPPTENWSVPTRVTLVVRKRISLYFERLRAQCAFLFIFLFETHFFL